MAFKLFSVYLYKIQACKLCNDLKKIRYFANGEGFGIEKVDEKY